MADTLAPPDLYYESSNFLVLNLQNSNKNFVRLHNTRKNIDATGTDTAGGRFITRIEPPENATTGYELTILIDRKYQSEEGAIGLFVWPWNYQKAIPSHPGFHWKTNPMNIIYPTFVPYTYMQIDDVTTPSAVNYNPDLRHQYYKSGSDTEIGSPNSTNPYPKASINYAPYFMDVISLNPTRYITGTNGSDYYYRPGDILFHGTPWVTYDSNNQIQNWNIQSSGDAVLGSSVLYKLWKIARTPKMIKLRYIENYIPVQHWTGATGAYKSVRNNYWVVESINLLSSPDFDLGTEMFNQSV